MYISIISILCNYILKSLNKMDKITRITEAQVIWLSFCFNSLDAEKWEATELRNRYLNHVIMSIEA